MKISKNTIDLLKNFSTINPSLYVESGSTIQTSSPYKNIFASAEVEEEFDQPFGIYELSRFLNIISVMPDPSFEFHEKYVRIVSGRQSVKYQYASKEMILNQSVDTSVIDSYEGDVTFSMASADLVSLRKGASILAKPELQFEFANNEIIARSIDLENKTVDDFSIVICETSQHVSLDPIPFSMETLKLIDGDYTVSLGDNSFGVFKNVDIPVYYAITTKASV